MTYNKHNLAVGKVASKSTIRPEMQCIAFYGDRTVATDSFRLLEVSAQGKKLSQPILLNAKIVSERVKLDKDELTISVEDIIARGVITTKKKYPNVDMVLDSKQHKYAEPIKVNGKYLAEIATVLSKMAEFEKIELYFSEEKYAPLIIKATSGDGQKARALLMPMNI